MEWSACIQLSEDPSEEELARDWSLSADDMELVSQCRGQEPKRHLALQLCVFRKHGRFLEDSNTVPLKILNYLRLQMGVAPVLITPSQEALHPRTIWEHEVKIREYCGFEPFQNTHLHSLEAHLLALANEGSSRELLLRRANEYLFDKRITAPGPTTLQKIVSSVFFRAEWGVFNIIIEKVPDTLCKKIDKLLEVEGAGTSSSLARYREFPPAPNPERILDYLDRYEELQSMGATGLDLSGVRTEVIVQFHSLVSSYDAFRIKRFNEKKRYSMVACFLSESSRIILDYIVEMNDHYLVSACRRSKNRFEASYRECRKKSKRGMTTMEAHVHDLLHTEENHKMTIEEWLKAGRQSSLSGALEDVRSLNTLEERGYYDQLKARYPQLRQYFPRFCELPFKAEIGGEIFLSGVKCLRKMNSSEGLEGLDEVITNQFLKDSQRRVLKSPDGKIQRGYWEFLFALQMRDAIRAGQLHLPGSRKNISFWNMIYDLKEWKAEKERHFSELSLPKASNEIFNRLTIEYDAAIDHFIKGLPDNKFAKIQNGELKLGRVEAEDEEADQGARSFLESALPKLRIEDLLKEVHKKCGFLDEFQPLAGYDARPSEKHEKILRAALIAHGTNLGIAAMGNSAKGITVDELSHMSRWYIRESSIKAANARIVDYHHRMRLTKSWGDGTKSSSDGQRFGVQKSSLLATFYPRYFGHYDRAVTVYTHTSDQFSVFHTDVISCSVREAVHVLDGLLENNTILRHQIHSTDTHGYTEHLFALCYLLGFSFRPRIKDLADQQLYKLDPSKDYGAEIEPLFAGKIDVLLIAEQWESMVRIAASLKDKTAPAHLIVSRLAKALSGDRLARAITELGRLVKTMFIFRYLSDPEMRHEIQKQLNRGEGRHQLAKHLFFANQGEFRDGDYEEMMNKASCLSLLSNAVVVANTAAIDTIMRMNPQAKTLIQKADLARITPLLFRRIIPNGTYHFRD